MQDTQADATCLEETFQRFSTVDDTMFDLWPGVLVIRQICTGRAFPQHSKMDGILLLDLLVFLIWLVKLRFGWSFWAEHSGFGTS